MIAIGMPSFITFPSLKDAMSWLILLILDFNKELSSCLLYTSDAADERSSVDLGGRRIIKKKKKKQEVVHVSYTKKTSCANCIM